MEALMFHDGTRFDLVSDRNLHRITGWCIIIPLCIILGVFVGGCLG